jgi:tRNA (cmo5U34)-methyltransferase
MNNSPPDAAWDENDSRHFIDYGAYFVPEREVQIDTICNVIPEPAPGSTVVEICSGEGLLAEALAR